MASIKKRENGQWRARYRDEGGREHSRHFTRKVDAQRWLDETTASVVTGQYVDPKAGRVTVREYAEQWRAAQVHLRARSSRSRASCGGTSTLCSGIGPYPVCCRPMCSRS